MSSLRPNQALVAAEIVLDGRLALFHQTERWLAVADLHFGYELSQRAAGRLVPMWGMASIIERLLQLVDEYRPSQLVILGDLVHDRTAAGKQVNCWNGSRIFVNRSSWRAITIANCGDRSNCSTLGKPDAFIFIMVIARPSHLIASRSLGIIIPLERFQMALVSG